MGFYFKEPSHYRLTLNFLAYLMLSPDFLNTRDDELIHRIGFDYLCDGIHYLGNCFISYALLREIFNQRLFFFWERFPKGFHSVSLGIPSFTPIQ